jgi:hypothetical protein
MKRNIYLPVITVITLAITAVTLKNNNPNNVYSPRVKKYSRDIWISVISEDH